jgi:hypothetical protein
MLEEGGREAHLDLLGLLTNFMPHVLNMVFGHMYSSHRLLFLPVDGGHQKLQIFYGIAQQSGNCQIPSVKTLRILDQVYSRKSPHLNVTSGGKELLCT